MPEWYNQETKTIYEDIHMREFYKVVMRTRETPVWTKGSFQSDTIRRNIDCTLKSKPIVITFVMTFLVRCQKQNKLQLMIAMECVHLSTMHVECS